MSQIKNVVPVEESAVPFAKDIHGDGKKTNGHLHRGYDKKRVADPKEYNPRVRIPSQGKAEHILEEEETGECLNGNFSVCINNVQGAGYSTQHHSHHLKPEKELRGEPTISGDVFATYAEAIEANAPEYELRDNQDQAELGLVDTTVSFGEDLCRPVGNEACEQKAKYGA